MSGVARRLVTFLFCQKESNQRKGHPAVPPLRGSFVLAGKLGGCATRPGQLAQNASCCGAQTVLAFIPIYLPKRSGTEGIENQSKKPRAKREPDGWRASRVVPGIFPPLQGEVGGDGLLLCDPFCAASFWQVNWDEGEHCLSSAAACVLCKLSRASCAAAQFTCQNEGTPQGRHGRVLFPMVTFL